MAGAGVEEEEEAEEEGRLMGQELEEPGGAWRRKLRNRGGGDLDEDVRAALPLLGDEAFQGEEGLVQSGGPQGGAKLANVLSLWVA